MSRVLDKIFLACNVQHHPSRARELARLLPALDGLDPQVIRDPGGRKPSTWRVHRLCLEALPPDATHLLVVQDDAIPCENFAALALRAVEEHPEDVLCLFVPGFREHLVAFDRARRRKARWTTIRVAAYVPLVATVYPAGHAREIVPFAEGRRTGPHRADDAVVAGYLRAHRVQVRATCPSLCEHDDDALSVMKMPTGRRSPHRVACWYDSTGKIWATPHLASPDLDTPNPDGPRHTASDHAVPRQAQSAPHLT